MRIVTRQLSTDCACTCNSSWAHDFIAPAMAPWPRNEGYTYTPAAPPPCDFFFVTHDRRWHRGWLVVSANKRSLDCSGRRCLEWLRSCTAHTPCAVVPVEHKGTEKKRVKWLINAGRVFFPCVVAVIQLQRGYLGYVAVAAALALLVTSDRLWID